MKRIAKVFAILLLMTLLAAQGAAAQTAVVNSGGLTIYTEGNPLSGSDIDSIRYVAADFPLPLVIYVTNQYRGAKIDFSKQIAKLVTTNNVVIGISTYKDNSVNYRYRLIGAGPQAKLSQSELDGAQNVADKYLRDPSGPQYANAISGVIGYLEATINARQNPNTGGNTSNGTGIGTGSSSSSNTSFWDVVIGFIVIIIVIWLIFLFFRWLWRLLHQGNSPQPQPRRGGGGGGYYDNGPVYYPIWLGGGSWGDGGRSSSGGGGGGNISTPSIPDTPIPNNAGGGSYVSPFGNNSAGVGNTDTGGGGGGSFASVFGKDSGGSSSGSSSSGGGGSFVSAIGSAASSGAGSATGAAVGEVAGAAINILGGILGAVFSAGSGGSGPDF